MQRNGCRVASKRVFDSDETGFTVATHRVAATQHAKNFWAPRCCDKTGAGGRDATKADQQGSV